jgi:hypothetical protein
VLEMIPNPGSPTFASGAPKFTQFKRLNASARNSRVSLSPIEVRFESIKSTVLCPGDRRASPRPRAPKSTGPGKTNNVPELPKPGEAK